MFPNLLVLDLDFTTARFVGGFEAIYETVRPFGIDHETARQVLEDTVHTSTGFNFVQYARALGNVRSEIDQTEMVKSLDALLESGFRTYDDVNETFRHFHAEKTGIRIITAGNRSFQTRKLLAIGFAPSNAHFTDITVGKAKEIAFLCKQLPPGGTLWYVDDRREELVRIAENPNVPSERVRLFEIVRSDCPNIAPRPDPRFERISSFRELLP